MLVKYCELLYPVAGKSKFLGWYVCDREDFYEFFNKKSANVWMIGVVTEDGRKWHWSKNRGWIPVKDWQIDKNFVQKK